MSEILSYSILVDIRKLNFILLVKLNLSLHYMVTENDYFWYLTNFQDLSQNGVFPH